MCMFRWRGFQPHHLSAGPYIDSFLHVFCPDPHLLAPTIFLPPRYWFARPTLPSPAARAPPSRDQGLALGGAEPGWGAGGQRGPNRVGWRSATHTLNFARLWRGGVSRGVIWRPLCFPRSRGETSLGKMGLYRVRVSTGSSLCAGSNNQVHLWLVGEHGEAALGGRLRPARGKVSWPGPGGVRGAPGPQAHESSRRAAPQMASAFPGGSWRTPPARRSLGGRWVKRFRAGRGTQQVLNKCSCCPACLELG